MDNKNQARRTLNKLESEIYHADFERSSEMIEKVEDLRALSNSEKVDCFEMLLEKREEIKNLQYDIKNLEKECLETLGEEPERHAGVNFSKVIDSKLIWSDLEKAFETAKELGLSYKESPVRVSQVASKKLLTPDFDALLTIRESQKLKLTV